MERVMSERMPALFSAMAVAMSARTDGLNLHAVEDMRSKAEELLPRDAPLRLAIQNFATMYEIYHRDAYALRKLGEELERAIDAALHPDRPAPAIRRGIDD